MGLRPAVCCAYFCHCFLLCYFPLPHCKFFSRIIGITHFAISRSEFAWWQFISSLIQVWAHQSDPSFRVESGRARLDLHIILNLLLVVCSMGTIFMIKHVINMPLRAYFFFGRTFDLVSGRQCICACAMPHPLCT